MGRSPNERVVRAARRLARKRVKALNRELQKLEAVQADGGDTADPVHDTRVAARRLRSALDLVEPVVPAKKFKRWMRSLRKLIHGLGEARDLDVQLEFVAKQLAACDEKRRKPGLDRLRLRLAQRWTLSDQRLEKVTAKIRQKRTLLTLGEWLDGNAPGHAAIGAVGANITSIDVSASTAPMAEQITQRLRERLTDLLAFDEVVYVPGETQKLHDMRTAAKRLRYTLELVKPVSSGRFDHALAASATLQDLLGDLHDCDVWIAFLPRFVDEETQRTADYFGHTTPMSRVRPGIDWLLQSRRQARQRAYRRLLEFWRQSMRDHVWSSALDNIQK